MSTDLHILIFKGNAFHNCGPFIHNKRLSIDETMQRGK